MGWSYYLLVAIFFLRNTVVLCIHCLWLQNCGSFTVCLVCREHKVWKGQSFDVCLCFRFAENWMESVSPVAKVPKTGHPCQWRWSSAPSWGTSISFTKTSLFGRWIVWEGMWRFLHVPCILSYARNSGTERSKARCKCAIGLSPGLAEKWPAACQLVSHFCMQGLCNSVLYR